MAFVEGFALPVYILPLVQGHLHTEEPYPDYPVTLERQIRTVRDLGQFVAKGTVNPQPLTSHSPDSWTLTAESILRMIVKSQRLAEIEPKFAQRAEYLLPRLNLLAKLPPVLCHIDFFEINIMVEPITGASTAVLDWDSAQLEAFGMVIYGVYDSFFGSMSGHSDDAEWSWFETLFPHSGGICTAKQILETTFWDAFWGAVPPSIDKTEHEEAIQVAFEVAMVQRNLSRSLIEGPGERHKDLLKNSKIMRGIWLSR